MELYIPQEEIRATIVNDIVKKSSSIVPIIGDDCIVYKEDESSKEIPFQEFIVQEFKKKYPHINVADRDIKSMKERGYYGLSLLSQHYNQRGRFLDDFMEFVNGNYSKIRLKEEVYNFLETFNFPIIITTVCFDFIENQLKGKLDNYRSIWYKLNRENRSLPSRCIYHIFGQAKDGSKWVSDEDLLLTFLLSHNHKDNEAIGLTDYLKENEKKLFVLGCNLPNWIFRFLWQPTQAGRYNNTQTTQGYWINKEKPEDSFENFLKKKNFSTDEQVKEILQDATKLLKEQQMHENAKRASIFDSEEQFDVFISYASEDRNIALQVFEALKNINVSVWIDDRGKGEITPGKPYWKNIEKGIKHSTHYMPIITGNWMRKLTSTSSLKEETMLVRDWFAECDRNESKTSLKENYSIPVIIKNSTYNDVDIDASYIENLSGMGLLPKSLFFHIDMIEFGGNNYSVFEKIEW